MEGTRRPELRPFLTELQNAAVKSATLIFEAAGLNPEPQQMEELSRLLNGYVFSSLTISGAPDDTARGSSTGCCARSFKVERRYFREARLTADTTARSDAVVIDGAIPTPHTVLPFTDASTYAAACASSPALIACSE
jgi:Tetracyclin repressor-like, C-terminal domain